MHFNIADLIESLAAVIPDKDALVSEERRLSYRQLDERATRLGHALAARGIGHGDHVGLYLFNDTEYIEAMLACFKIRAVPININYRYVEEELRYLCENADLKALLYHREFGPRVAAVAHRVPTLTTLIHVEDGSAAELASPDSVEYESALLAASPENDFAARSGDDLYIIYTGGTTGMPRGVMWRQEDIFFAGLQGGAPGQDPIERPEELAAYGRTGERAVTMMSAAPFIHGAAQFATWIGLFIGGKVVIARGKSMDATQIWGLIEKEQVNTLLVVGDAICRPLGDVLAASLGSEKPIDASSLSVIASSGAILSAAVKDRLSELLPSCLILNNFGATETGHQGSAFPGADGSTPRLTFYMNETNTVLDDSQRPVVPGSGVMGRLARCGRVPVGYYNDPVKTAQTFIHIDGRRWVVPGDLATVEADGLITVFGRGAVCINSGGEKIFPEEVEEALKAHPAVHDVVVVGVPDERWGERVAALVQATGTSVPTIDELSAHCRTRVAGYKIPRELHLVDLIARHPSGKPDYRWAKSTAMGRAPDGTRDLLPKEAKEA